MKIQGKKVKKKMKWIVRTATRKRPSTTMEWTVKMELRTVALKVTMKMARKAEMTMWKTKVVMTVVRKVKMMMEIVQ